MTVEEAAAGVGHVEGLVRVLPYSLNRAPDGWSLVPKGRQQRIGPGALIVADSRGQTALVHAPKAALAVGPLLWARIDCADPARLFDALNAARRRQARVKGLLTIAGFSVLVAMALGMAYAASLLVFALLIIIPFSIFFALIAHWESGQVRRVDVAKLKETRHEFSTPRARRTADGWAPAERGDDDDRA